MASVSSVDNLMWERHYVFPIGMFIWRWCRLWFLAACRLMMCIGALKIEGFMKWVTTSAKLSWILDLHIHTDVHPLPENSSPPAFLGSFVSCRWISSCRANGRSDQDWRHYKFKPCFRVVPLWTVLSFLVSVTEKTSDFCLMVRSQCCQWTCKSVFQQVFKSMRFWALSESFSDRRRRWLCGCLGFYRRITCNGKDQRLKCGLEGTVHPAEV